MKLRDKKPGLPIALACCLVLLVSAAPADQQQQCRSLCATCQSLSPARINQVCSAPPLTACGCPENALNLTATPAPRPQETQRTAGAACPVTNGPGNSAVFCPFGQRMDPVTGCPSPACLPPPGCQQQQQGCPLFCPDGFQTDPGTGCPLCRCRCRPSPAVNRCAAECAKIGATPVAMTTDAGNDSETTKAGYCQEPSVCLCSLSLPSTLQPPQSHQPQPPTCLLRCPNSCGPHGFANPDGARDERGCVRDCACRCPTGTGCPNPGDTCHRWEIDRFGCQTCTACRAAAAARCVSGASSVSLTLADLCRGVDCPAGGFAVAPDDAGCLACRCLATAATRAPSSPPPPSPLCLGPGDSLTACLAGCQSGNASVVRDAGTGCYACRCYGSGNSDEGGGGGNNSGAYCPPWSQRLRWTCGNSCGPHGFATDPVTGCQRSCACACGSPGGADCPPVPPVCFYGNRKDLYGCDTCHCLSAVEYLQLMPL